MHLYRSRWLFHGPRFQVLADVRAIHTDGVRTALTVSDVPGALLDGVGQSFAAWLVEVHDGPWLAFPIRIGRLRFHAPLPPAGTVVECAVRIREVTDDRLVADAQVVHDGTVLISVEGWVDHLFDCPRAESEVYRFPESNTVARRRPEGWWLAAEAWSGLATRQLWLQRWLHHEEAAQYAAQPPREQRAWLLTRIAVKDIARARLWDDGAGPVFPAQLTVHDAGPGAYTVSGTDGLATPDLTVLATSVGTSVAAVALDGTPPPGAAIHVVPEGVATPAPGAIRVRPAGSTQHYLITVPGTHAGPTGRPTRP